MGAALKGPWDDDPDGTAPQAPARGPWDDDEDAPGALESYARHAHQAATFGFADEAEGAIRAAGDVLTGGDFDYTKRRDEARARLKAAEEAHPDASTAGTWGGTIGSALIPGGGSKTLLGNVGRGAAMGAAMGLGESEADLTKGEVGKAALDTGLGGLVGGAVGAVAHGAGKLVDAVRNRAAGGARLAEADRAAAEYGKRYAAQKSAQGSFGGEAAAVQNRVGHWREIAQNVEGRYSPAEVAQAERLLASPEADEAIRRAGVNSMKEGGNRMVEGLQSAEAAYDSARAAMDPNLIEAGADAGMAHPFREVVLPRVKKYLTRAVPAYLGAQVGGIPGAIVGWTAGAALGDPGTSLANMLKSPSFRKMAWQVVQGGAGALGKFGPALQRAATELGIGGARALHESLLDTDPEYQAQVQTLLEQTQGGQ